jgi:hypothetical protein
MKYKEKKDESQNWLCNSWKQRYLPIMLILITLMGCCEHSIMVLG